MCLHRQTATSQARETEDAVAQNWWWPKKKKCFGREPKSNDTEGWWDSDAAMDSASLNTEALQRKQMRGSPGSVSRRRRGMLSEREVNEDSRMKESQKRGMKEKDEEEMWGEDRGANRCFFAALRATILFNLDFGGFVLCPTRTHHLYTPLMLKAGVRSHS